VSKPVAYSTFSTLEVMLDDVRRTTAATLNATQAITNGVKQGLAEDADPHVMVGAMIEGIALTMLYRLPEDVWPDIANDLHVLLQTCLGTSDCDGLTTRPPQG